MKPNLQTMLKLQNLKLPIRIGCTDEERATEQFISVNINIFFPTPPKGCLTDNIKDTVCYAAITKILDNAIAHHEFQLIEHLGHKIYQLIKSSHPKLKITVEVSKKPPIAHLNTVSFCYGD